MSDGNNGTEENQENEVQNEPQPVTFRVTDEDKIQYSADGEKFADVPYTPTVDGDDVTFDRPKKTNYFTKKFEEALQNSANVGLEDGYDFTDAKLTFTKGSETAKLNDKEFEVGAEVSDKVVEVAPRYKEPQGLSFKSGKGLATSAGALVLLGVAWNRFKAMLTGQKQTEEEIEAGEEPKKKSFFSKVANGITAIATAAVGVSLAMDVAQGRGFGDTAREKGATLGKWTGLIKNQDAAAKDTGPQR